ncbi:hypothetical protein BD779DRAFT_1116570 [Infundibulicybe gibba]|nr:hypothetical protein BD779DRAFT_1116570 [Infundibulicybe gibba]
MTRTWRYQWIFTLPQRDACSCYSSTTRRPRTKWVPSRLNSPTHAQPWLPPLPLDTSMFQIARPTAITTRSNHLHAMSAQPPIAAVLRPVSGKFARGRVGKYGLKREDGALTREISQGLSQIGWGVPKVSDFVVCERRNLPEYTATEQAVGDALATGNALYWGI